MKLKLIFCAIFFFISGSSFAQARLTINNNSLRSMAVKVMQGRSGKGALHETVTIGAYSSETIYFAEEGYYFTKTKASIKGKDPVYRRGQAFEVISNSTGYSVLTITFSIKEYKVPQATGGKQISKKEYDED